MASKFRQEMPPEGGYGPIEWAKKSTKKLNGKKVFAVWLGVNVASYFTYVYCKKRIDRQDLEMREGRIALEPLMQAERDRLTLKQLRRNRDEENELMRFVPGWETGTLYGSPVYHNKFDRYIPLNFREYYAHAPWKDQYERITERARH